MRKLLEQALVALEGAVFAGKTIEYYSDPRLKPLRDDLYSTLMELGYKKEALVNRAIEAIREELAKPEPEPVAWMMINPAHPDFGKSLVWQPPEVWHFSWQAVPLYK
jgi:hypothetical protein